MDPHARRLDDLHHRLAGHHRGAGVGVAAHDQAIDRRHQAQVGTLRAQRVALGAQPGEFLLYRLGASSGGLMRGGGRVGLLALACGGLAADAVRLQQAGVAGGLRVGKAAPRADLAHLRLGGEHVGLGPAQPGLLRDQTLVEVDRVHLAHLLAGAHRIARLHRDRRHAPGEGRPDAMGVARLHRADAEQRRRERLRLHRRHGHRHRGQRAGAQGDEDEQAGERQQHREQAQEPPIGSEPVLHGCLRMPRR